MCSVNDDDDSTAFMPENDTQNLTGILCKKCNENVAVIVLRKQDVYCRDCFLVSATHKFRGTLGKHKLVKASDDVLVAYSGSSAGTTLLHMLMCGMQEDTYKRIPFTSSVLYIDENILLGHSLEERKETCRLIEKQTSSMNFPLYLTTLSKSLKESSDEKICFNSSDMFCADIELDNKLLTLFANVHSLTARQDLLYNLRYRLLLISAKELGCSKIFVADTATSLSQRILSNVALGRGAHLPLDIGFTDTRNPEVPVIRPMRELLNKEIVYYNTFNKLHASVVASLSTKEDTHSSIQKLTEHFIADLEVNFPSTVYTIFRTGNKLSLGKDVATSDERCLLCEVPLDTRNPEPSSALQATLFSQVVSSSGPSCFDYQKVGKLVEEDSNRHINVSKGNCSDSNEHVSSCACVTSSCISNNITKKEISDLLCYGCMVIIKEMNNTGLECLPADVLTNAREKIQFKKMRQEIQDFLL